ncbi:PQQ-dependent sugar dehydrogenase [Halorubrum sp. CGM5_25_10-8B]|uniref:PQQ-dependent sugar dehydrogenase n=1 Tax=Halorubrum sp. CGM5_25_10-8B TaxID=2518115 RepID=UPI0010F57B26|nr:PQQ-dependent sugar dehydrogenase [Halorubrum sp. CGM5_25_10-8B]TKX38280.1 PQQ-dependent sugar dehydrogenase [Halorubrum sp. CGM5_25_10-8B]
MTDLPDRADRRTVLRATAGLAGIAAFPAVAGCLGGGGSPGGDEAGGSGDDGGDAPPDDGAGVAYDVETVAEGFENPWALAFLPDDGRLLVTERPGRLSLVDPADGAVEAVAGAPEVFAEGQGGLLDVAVHPDYPVDPRVYLTYAAANDAGEATTHVGTGRLSLDGGDAPVLDEFEPIRVAEPFRDGANHFGSRATFGPEGSLFVTVGDRRDTDFGPDHVSQDRSNELGATLRLTPDGDAHPDNPFVDDPDAADALYSYGHRNPQAMAVRSETGRIWQCEHGEEDGDEINVIERGGDYGWPVASEACRYGTDDPFAPGHEDRDGVIAPVHHWPCGSGGFPPSGAVFYDGDAFPEWRGDLFAGTLAARYLGRFTVDGDGLDATVTEREPLLADRGWRMRAVAVEPDTGNLYVAVDDDDAPVARVVPT